MSGLASTAAVRNPSTTAPQKEPSRRPGAVDQTWTLLARTWSIVRTWYQIYAIAALLSFFLWTYYVNAVWSPVQGNDLGDSRDFESATIPAPASADTIFLPLGQTIGEVVHVEVRKLDWQIDAWYCQLEDVQESLGCGNLPARSLEKQEHGRSPLVPRAPCKLTSTTAPPHRAHLDYLATNGFPGQSSRCRIIIGIQSKLSHLAVLLRTDLQPTIATIESHLMQAQRALDSLPHPSWTTRSLSPIRTPTTAALLCPEHILNLRLPYWTLTIFFAPIWLLTSPLLNTHDTEDDYASARAHFRTAWDLTQRTLLPRLHHALPAVDGIGHDISTLFSQYPGVHDGHRQGFLFPQEVFVEVGWQWWTPRPHRPSEQHQNREQEPDELRFPAQFSELTQKLCSSIEHSRADVERWEREGAFVRGFAEEKARDRKMRAGITKGPKAGPKRSTPIWRQWDLVLQTFDERDVGEGGPIPEASSRRS